ncbi:MAG: hypothetical protein IJX82_07450 [Clostridia bacterium]|nr:hypothetical protein [Clostridia bacterium]
MLCKEVLRNEVLRNEVLRNEVLRNEVLRNEVSLRDNEVVRTAHKWSVVKCRQAFVLQTT